jgi:MFS family permease
MAIVMMLMGMAQNIWQFLLLRALLGLLGGQETTRQRAEQGAAYRAG